MAAELRFGIEEEYFLADATTRGAVRKVQPGFIEAAQAAFPDEVQREMLQSQIEVATAVCTTMDEARSALVRLRSGLAGIAGQHGMLLLASGTHPCAVWSRQRVTEAARYDRLMRELQMIGSRNQLCGLHVHVEIPDEDERIRLMARIMPYLPLLLALSTSSPFWQGRRTGLMGYRLAAYAELPRTGLPELFVEPGEYRAYVAALVRAGAIKDESYIWWALRPSKRHPTLELRIADSCTNVEDTLALAALYRCIVRHLLRNPSENAKPAPAMRGIAVENFWRAQRYGIHGGLIDGEGAGMRPIPEIIDRLLPRLAEDASALGCKAELERCAHIARDGTSADRQLAIHEAVCECEGEQAALAATVDWIAAQTSGGAGALATERLSALRHAG